MKRRREVCSNEERYRAQEKDTFDCAPVAIYNLAMWLGLNTEGTERVTYDEIHRICHPDKSYGTYNKNFLRALELISDRSSIQIDVDDDPNIYVLKAHLQNGGAFILLYHWEDGDETGEHYVFVDGYNDLTFRVINDLSYDRLVGTLSEYAVVRETSFRRFKKMLMTFEYPPRFLCCRYDCSFPTAWLVTKK